MTQCVNMPQKHKLRLDWQKLFYISIATLLTFGLLMVYNASIIQSQNIFGNKFHFLMLQIAWVVLGLTIAFIIRFLGVNFFSKFSKGLFLLSFLFTLLVFVPGIGLELKGARRWLNFGFKKTFFFWQFQPVELLKFSLIIYFADLYSKLTKNKNQDLIHIFIFLIIALLGLPFLGFDFTTGLALIGIMVGFIFLKFRKPWLLLLMYLLIIPSYIIAEPDFGSAMIAAIIIVSMYFLSNLNIIPLLFSLPLFAIAGLLMIIQSPYRRDRLLTYLGFLTNNEKTEKAYHLQQVLIALGSGGLFGLGLGQSRQKYSYIPEVASDSILAVIGEELGFIGCFVLIILFLTLIFSIFKIGEQRKDVFGRLLCFGIATHLAVQILVNISAMTGILPLTGIPLPLISYGGSSMVFTLAELGLVMAVSKKQ